jgi:ABC-type Fe3+-siderophore transport system permease subunit
MEQISDLSQYVNAMLSITTFRNKWKTFNKIALGRPALGNVCDVYPYHDDMKEAVKTIAKDVAIEKQKKAALVYLGHGNETWLAVIFDVRLPIILPCAPVDEILAVSGNLFQGILLNPFADPYTLGFSVEAAFGARIAILLNLSAVYVSVPLFAFIGACTTFIIRAGF